MGELTLFDLAPEYREPEPSLSAGRRRTIRQRALLDAGRHPLTAVAARPLRLHPDAPPPADRNAPGPRCGSCRFRAYWGAQSFPKCMRGADADRDGPYTSHSAATDCRAWWPACEHWQAIP